MRHRTILSPLLFQPSLISQSLLLLWVDAGAPTVWVPVQSFQRTFKSMEKQMVSSNKVWRTAPYIVHWIGTSSSRHFEVYGLAVLIQPRNKFTLPTKCISMTPRTTHFSKLPWVGLERTTLCYYLHVFLLLHCTRLQRYRHFHFAVCHTIYNCGCLLNIVGLCLKISSAVSSTITAILTLLRWGMQV